MFGFGVGAAPAQNLPTINRDDVCNDYVDGIGIAGDSPGSFQTFDEPVGWTIARVVCK